MEQKPAFVSAVQGGYTNIDVPCLHQLQPWNLTLTFTSDGTIGGVHISAYSTGLPSIPDGITETELPLPIANGRTLPGYLTMPDNAENCDAVVLVHGSGSSDHDETIGQIRPFQDLAWGLAQKGFAVYRYDKISAVYGEELANDPTFTVYDETVNDAAAAIELLRSQPGIRSVSVLGHSQGGMMMGAIAASGSPDSCILMAAPAESFADTLLDQLDFLEEHGHTVSSDAALYDALKELADTLKDIDSLSDDATVMGLYPAYLRSLADYDAVKEAKKIQVPVLVLQGEEDYQVPMKNFRLWQEECKDFANWNFASFPNLTHLFTEGSYENGPADYSGEKHIPQEVIDRIADFLSDTFCS